MSDEPNAVRKEQELREHEAEARRRAEGEEGDDESLGTPDSDANPAPPGNIQGANLGGAS